MPPLLIVLGFRAGLVTILVDVRRLAPAPVRPQESSTFPTLLLLCAVRVAVDASGYVVVARTASRAARTLSRPRVRLRLERISGAVLVGLSVGLGVERA